MANKSGLSGSLTSPARRSLGASCALYHQKLKFFPAARSLVHGLIWGSVKAQSRNSSVLNFRDYSSKEFILFQTKRSDRWNLRFGNSGVYQSIPARTYGGRGICAFSGTCRRLSDEDVHEIHEVGLGFRTAAQTSTSFRSKQA